MKQDDKKTEGLAVDSVSAGSKSCSRCNRTNLGGWAIYPEGKLCSWCHNKEIKQRRIQRKLNKSKKI